MRLEGSNINRNKSHYDNSKFISKLNKQKVQENTPTESNLKRKSKKINTARGLRAHSFNVDKNVIKNKIFDTENLIERLKEQNKYTAANIKSINDKKRFNVYSSKSSSIKLKDENKKIRENIKMKRVSLMITRNEATKLNADIEDAKANYKIRINRFENELEVVNLQVRNLR